MGYLALAALLASLPTALTLRACEGELVPPLDDTYIYLQYARAAARGEPLSYQPGAAPTRGATSLLYPLVLAPAAAVLPPGRLPWAALVLGVLCMAGSALAVDRWARRRMGETAAVAAGVLTLLSGHFLWGGVSGMDIALYAAALAAGLALLPWYQEAPSPASGVRRLLVYTAALGLLAVARPEGALPALILAGAAIAATRAPNSRRARLFLLVGPLVAVGASWAITLLAVGDTTPNTLAAKAIWSEQRPDVRAAMISRLPWVLGQITRAFTSDFRSPSFGHGTGTLLEALLTAGAGFAVLAGAHRRSGAPERALILVLLAGLLAGLIPAGFNSHHHRYQMPYIPLFLLLVVTGWTRFLSRSPRGWSAIPSLLIAILLVPGTLSYSRMVAANASNIRDHQVAVGRWVREHLPETAILGINDAGAIAFYGDRPVVDLVGLVTTGPALPNRAGPASLYEWLETLPPSSRPTHFAIFPSWFPYLKRTSLIGDKLAQFTLGHNTISGSDVKSVYVANWDRVGWGSELWHRRALVDLWEFEIIDEVDVADLASERAHDYRAFTSWRGTLREFEVQDRPGLVFIEGGRQPTRGERFRLRSRRGEPAVLVMRTEAFRPFSLDVLVNGRPAGTWTVDQQPLRWTEPTFALVDTLITSDILEIELVQPDSLPPYPSFHYWLLQ